MATKLKDLKSVAQDINEKVDPDPNIPVSGAKKADLEKSIKAIAEQVIIPEEDDLSDESKAVMDELGCNPWAEAGAEAESQEEEKQEEETAKAEPEESKEQEKSEESGKDKKKDINVNTPKQNTTGKSATQLVKEMIQTGENTRKDVIDSLVELGYKKTTPSTIISDAMSEKYQKFEKLVVKDENGKLVFAD